MKTPQIFVGTLFCGEGDYEKHSQSISNQKNVIVSRHIIANKQELEAHNELWASWNDRKKDGFDMFVKIDADTILTHENILFDLWNLMYSNSDVTGIQAPLQDFYTDDLINGLNCFSPDVVFNQTTDPLYCDRKVDVNHKRTIGSSEVPASLRPAGMHCYCATEIQSFHFGLHRYLKNQKEILSKVRRAYFCEPRENRAYALLGAMAAKDFIDGGFNYTDKKFIDAFDYAKANFENLVSKL